MLRLIALVAALGCSLATPDTGHQHRAPLSLLHDLVIGDVVPCCGPRSL